TFIDECIDNQRHRRRGVLAPDVDQKLAEMGRQLPREAAIGSWRGPKSCEAGGAVGIEPTLKRGDRIGACAVGARRPGALGAQGTELSGEYAVSELAVHDGADDRSAKDRDGLGVIGRSEIHFEGSFLRPAARGPCAGLLVVEGGILSGGSSALGFS